MSAALQRVIVRMLHDPLLVQAVHAGAHLPELDAVERAQLLRVDPRAFRVDAFRRSRLLHALIEELPAAACLASEGGRALGRLDAFLSSEAFHRSVQDRGLPVLAFAEWLRAQAGDVAVLEGGVARARRDPPRPAGQGALQRARGILPLRLAQGTVARWQALLARMGPRPLEALVAGRVPTRRLPALGPGMEDLLVEVGADGAAALAGSSPELGALLAAAEEARPHDALLSVARALGAGEEAGEIVQGLVEDGLLVEVSAALSR